MKKKMFKLTVVLNNIEDVMKIKRSLDRYYFKEKVGYTLLLSTDEVGVFEELDEGLCKIKTKYERKL